MRLGQQDIARDVAALQPYLLKGSIVTFADRYVVLNAVDRTPDGSETLTLDNAKIPETARAVLFHLQVKCTAAGAGAYYHLGPEVAGDDRYHYTAWTQVNNLYNSVAGVLRVASDGTNALLYGNYGVNGGTLTVSLWITGYVR